MSKTTFKKVIITFFILFFLCCVLAFAQKITNSKKSPLGTWQIKVIDDKTNAQLEYAKLVVTDINETYIISPIDNTVSLQQKPNKYTEKYKYPYGYTIITYAEGYLPRIDHNISIGANDVTNILISLTKSEPLSNQSYTEFFHYSPETEMLELFEYYKIK